MVNHTHRLATLIAVATISFAMAGSGCNPRSESTQNAPPGATPAATAAVQPTPSPAATAPGGYVVGSLDAETVAVAMTAAEAFQVRLRANADGKLTKLAVYHNDPARMDPRLLAAVEPKFPGAKPTFYESELYHDLGRVGEVELITADGRHCEIGQSLDGRVQYSECRIPESNLPPVIAQAVAAAVPGGKIEETELQEEAGTKEYTVKVKIGERMQVFVFTEAGELKARWLRLPATLEVPMPG